MDGVKVVADQAVQASVVAGVGHADPKQVAEFERLMQDPMPNQLGLDRYINRVESPMDAFSSAAMRVGGEISRAFQVQAAKSTTVLSPEQLSNPAAVMERIIDLQKGLMTATFQIQFATSLVESANKGISTLFRMQG